MSLDGETTGKAMGEGVPPDPHLGAGGLLARMAAPLRAFIFAPPGTAPRARRRPLNLVYGLEDKVPLGALLALSDTFRGAEGAARFELLMDRMADQVRIFATQVVVDGKNSPGLDRWAAVWERLSNVPGEAEAVNLDRGDVFWSVISDLRAAAKTAI